MIVDEDISIVVQGPVLKDSALNITSETTAMVCYRLKHLFPKAELILSTWEGTAVENIPYDKVIYNKDPGATWFNYENYTLLNNCNRLIVSTHAGIKAATRKYVLKVRSDLFLVSKSFLNYFYQFPLFNESSRFVKNRILAFSIYTTRGHKNSLFTMQRPFHISDWAYFGYKEDLLDLYDIPLTEEPEFSQWFLTRCKPFFDIEPHRLWKMPPEQYVTSSFLKKHIPLSLEHTADTSNDNMAWSEQLLVNNFLVLDQTQFSLISLKYVNFQLLFEPLLSRTAILYSTWLDNYCDHMSFSKKGLRIKYKIISSLRTCGYHIANNILRLVDGKSGRVSKIAAYLLKRKVATMTKDKNVLPSPAGKRL